MESMIKYSKQEIVIPFSSIKNHLVHNIEVKTITDLEYEFISIMIWCHGCEETIGNQINFRIVED